MKTKQVLFFCSIISQDEFSTSQIRLYETQLHLKEAVNRHSSRCAYLNSLHGLKQRARNTAIQLLMFTEVGGSRLQTGSSAPDITVCFHLLSYNQYLKFIRV